MLRVGPNHNYRFDSFGYCVVCMQNDWNSALQNADGIPQVLEWEESEQCSAGRSLASQLRVRRLPRLANLRHRSPRRSLEVLGSRSVLVES